MKHKEIRRRLEVCEADYFSFLKATTEKDAEIARLVERIERLETNDTRNDNNIRSIRRQDKERQDEISRLADRNVELMERLKVFANLHNGAWDFLYGMDEENKPYSYIVWRRKPGEMYPWEFAAIAVKESEEL